MIFCAQRRRFWLIVKMTLKLLLRFHFKCGSCIWYVAHAEFNTTPSWKSCEQQRSLCYVKPVNSPGRRGVFEGVIEGLHQHWKHKELVKLISMQRTFLQVFYTAGNREWWFDSMH